MARSKGAIRAVARSLMKTLAVTAGVIVVSIILLAINPQLGAVALLAYSSFMVIRASWHDTPLTRFTALLPGGMALACYALQLSMMGAGRSVLPLLGFAAGIVLGWFLARGHTIYQKRGQVFARRTSLYVIIWVATYAFTQAAALAGLRDIAGFGLMLSGLSSAMVATLSVVLLTKLRHVKAPPATPRGAVAGLLIFITALTGSVLLQPSPAGSVQIVVRGVGDLIRQSGDYIFGQERASLPARNYKIDRKFNSWGSLSRYEYSIVWKPTSNMFDDLGVRFKLTHDANVTQAKPLAGGLEECRKNAKWIAGRGRIDLGGIGEYCVVLFARTSGRDKGIGDAVWIYGYWAYRAWTVKFTINDKPKHPTTMLGAGLVPYVNGMIGRVTQRIKSIEIVGAAPSVQLLTPPAPQRVTPPASVPTQRIPAPPSVSAAPPQQPVWTPPTFDRYQSVQLSNRATGGSVLAALLQMLTGLSMLGAQAMVQGAAAAAGSAGGASTDSPPTRTRILEGDDAIKWLMDEKNGYFRKDNTATQKFTDFMNSLPSESGPGLQGFAGDLDDKNNLKLDKDGRPTGNIVITIPDDTASDTGTASQPDATDQQPVATSATGPTPGPTQQPPLDPATVSDTGAGLPEPPDIARQVESPFKEPPALSEAHITPSDELDVKMQQGIYDLRRALDPIIKDKIKQGYFVRNPDASFGTIRKAWNGTLGWVINEGLGNFKGGLCGEFADWGEKWCQKDVHRIFGPGVRMERIVMNEKGSINHEANKIILQNGERYVIDFWKGIQDGHPVIVPEKDWIQHWRGAAGGRVTRSDLENDARIYAEALGNRDFVKSYVDKGHSATDKLERLSIARSFQREPWHKGE